MNVTIDITALAYGRGVSRYTSNLVTALSVLPQIKLNLFGYSWRQKTELEELAHQALRQDRRHQIHIQSVPPSLQSVLWQTLGMNGLTTTFPNTQVIHSWDWLQPPDRQVPLVSTIHDLAMLKYPDTAHPQILNKHQRSWQQLKDRHAQIIAVSHSTKKDIVELLNIPSHQVHVIYEALPLEISQTTAALEETEYDQIKQRLLLDKPYILFVGTREPRKNLQRLIAAWQPLSAEFDLVIAGDKGWDGTGESMSLATGDGLAVNTLRRPRFLGKVTGQELAVLYSEASVLAFPSLYEGFGLPILEAFHYGTPVVTSNVSSMVEVAGNAAELVDPLSVESIRQGLTTVLQESLPAQQQRLQKMIIRLHMFDWARIAQDTVQVYQRAIDIFNS